MERSLQTIAAFSTPEDAEVARLALQDEGIESFLEGATTVGLLWHVGALGGVKLQVAQADVPRARASLAKTAVSPIGGGTCSHCGASLPQGFDVCWSCDTPIGDAEQAIPTASPAEHEAGETANGLDDEEAELTAAGDAEAWRAFAAAMIGIFLCPPLLNFYSIWILLKVGFQDPPMSPKGSRNYYAAMCLNAVVCCVVGWFVLTVMMRRW
jgi:hypothetical protein